MKAEIKVMPNTASAKALEVLGAKRKIKKQLYEINSNYLTIELLFIIFSYLSNKTLEILIK